MFWKSFESHTQQNHFSFGVGTPFQNINLEYSVENICVLEKCLSPGKHSCLKQGNHAYLVTSILVTSFLQWAARTQITTASVVEAADQTTICLAAFASEANFHLLFELLRAMFIDLFVLSTREQAQNYPGHPRARITLQMAACLSRLVLR